MNYYGLLLAALCVDVFLPGLASCRLLDGSRLASFPAPDFATNFTLRAQEDENSSKKIHHGLNTDPAFVRVFAVANDGNNRHFCFNGVGSTQDAPGQSAYGGLVYAVNDEFVQVWAPTTSDGHIIFVQDGWGGEINTQQSDEATVFVEVWANFPQPTFRRELNISNAESFREVRHDLQQLPELVMVKVHARNPKIPGQGLWFPGISASQNFRPPSLYGGVIFAYNERAVRLWSPHLATGGCAFVGDGWGERQKSKPTQHCFVSVELWVNQLPVPSFRTDWFTIHAQRGGRGAYKEVYHNLGLLPSLVIVQLKVKYGSSNKGFVFEGQGGAQTGDNNPDGYGGVVFAYNNRSIRLWAPSKHDGSARRCLSLLVKSDSWGNGRNSQQVESNLEVLARIVVYAGKCNETLQSAYMRNQCLTSIYGSFKWKTEKDWSECSSICNNGVEKKRLTGCQATAKTRVQSWNFQNGLEGWVASPHDSWYHTSNHSSPANLTWGRTRGSFYVYTLQTWKNIQPAYFMSPPFSGGTKCYLHFFWSMHGYKTGTLSVQYVDNPKAPSPDWKDTGWSMSGNQGSLWRAGYINLEKFGPIYRIRFKHEGCQAKPCDHGVGLDAVRLDCEVASGDLGTATCMDRMVPYAGCPRLATDYDTKGPAYSTETIKGRTYVTANGSLGNVIAAYSFQVMFPAEYVLWKEAYRTNKTADNSTDYEFSFRIGEGDWHTWKSPKSSYRTWTQHVDWRFTLNPGKHTVTLKQLKGRFHLRRLMLVPKNISSWTDLGLQSRHIPDSYLTSYPSHLSSIEPKYGRLHGPDAWCWSDRNNGFGYFQVKLPDFALLTGIAVQGYAGNPPASVKKFKLQISIDGERFSWYRETNKDREFRGTTNGYYVEEHMLQFVAPARAVRVFPIEMPPLPCLRLELYGVYLPRGLCAAAGRPPLTTRPCIGDRKCGKNMACRKSVISNSVGPSITNSNSSSSSSNSSATSNQEECDCVRGYHGPSCEYKGCSPNPCKNNGTCHDVTDDFTCDCSPGYHGDLCQHPCKNGSYGKDCANRCQCGVHGSCDLVTGHCSCERGYNGTYCKQRCVAGHYGYDCKQKCTCQNGASCDIVTGSCNCPSGWTGAFCELPCPKDSWGEGCNTSCSCTASASACDRFTGGCTCSDGFHGKLCELKCPHGSYGRNCSHSCRCNDVAGCSHVDGTCNCTRPGFTGVLCDQPCQPGFFGVDCAESCKCHDGTCDRVTGDCVCHVGWSGVTCNTSCPQGYWGRNCTLPCPCTHGAQCNPTNGKCECTGNCSCHSGWTGAQCNLPCAPGHWGPSCTQNCACVNGGECDQESGTCSCPPGFSGQKCETRCSADRYGVDCRHNCSCRRDTSLPCDSVSGLCRCVAGWQGQTCGIPCPGGLWGMNCSKTCRCVHGSCDPTSGNCTCDRGWQGASCDQPCSNCSGPCKCYHGNSSAVCGSCTCHAGYQGNSCLSACSAGYYGNQCQLNCTCANGASCHNVDGSCDCSPGWTGPQCDRGCPLGKFGRGCNQTCTCENGACDPVSGVCSCIPGYHGSSCNLPCPLGAFGKDCQSKCLCMNGAACDHVSGACTCAVGWTGPFCNVTCSSGFYGRNCSERCRCPQGIPCDSLTGACSCGAGWQGPTCAHSCPAGSYGADCSRPCTCRHGASCDHVNGTCTCAPGWTGPNCTSQCPHGHYGMFCASECHCPANFTEPGQPCDHVTGKCYCRPGYQGASCLEQCARGTYGRYCRNNCTCQNGADCSATDGTCTCRVGFHGDRCQDKCSQPHYGVLCNSTCNCVRNRTASCDHVDGSCSCARGYTGVRCENTCSQGTYGTRCESMCKCQNGSACDHVDGTCTCLAGFSGPTCSQPCAQGTFGLGCVQRCRCHNGATCDRVTGRCDCAPGYKGKRCGTQCEPGRYGVGCSSICDCYTNHTQSCTPRDGTCECRKGHKGVRCGQNCSAGFYGSKCGDSCICQPRRTSGTCHPTDGRCNCVPGFRGFSCRDDCDLAHYGPNCAEACHCAAPKLCHHADGTCLDLSGGRFDLLFDCNINKFYERDVNITLKRKLEELVDKFFDRVCTSFNVTWTEANKLRRHVRDTQPVSQQQRIVHEGRQRARYTRDAEYELHARDIHDGNHARTTGDVRHARYTRDLARDTPHDFTVRLLSLSPAFKWPGGEEISLGELVLLDGHRVVSSRCVPAVLERVSQVNPPDIGEDLYHGRLLEALPSPTQPPPRTGVKSHLPLIIGLGVGLFLFFSIVIAFTINRKSHSSATARPRNSRKKSEAEMELQPRSAKDADPFRLAFQNPYYDVFAAMGLEDDLEEEFFNPLYEDASLCSDSTDDSYYGYLSGMVIR